jgi:hypothetical protein
MNTQKKVTCVVYYGESWGARAHARRVIAKHFDISPKWVSFEECDESEAYTEMRRFPHDFSGGAIAIGWYELRDIEAALD